MSSPSPTNLPASVHQRLINLARTRRQDANLVLNRFALERFLYRLSRSPHADAFVLKGAMLFLVWTGDSARPTRDVDFLARIEPDPALVRRMIDVICRTSVEPDGLDFRSELLDLEAMQALRQFGGFRATVPVFLGRTRLQVQIDLGFGDAVTPAPQQLEFPTLLDFPAPHLAAYPMASVIAEKVEAMLKLGTANTRTKDYFDLLTLSRAFPFSGQELASALFASCNARGTTVPRDVPAGLVEAFGQDAAAQSRWTAFLNRNELPREVSWAEAVTAVRSFAWPPLQAAGLEFTAFWPAGGPWRS